MKSQGSILVVDDCANNLLSFREVLAPLNREILTCESGAEALHLISAHKISVILMDVQMPEMNGFEVADILKSRPSTADIPILFITAAHDARAFEQMAYRSGACDFMTKPADPFLLKTKVEVFQKLHDQRQEIETLVKELQLKNSQLEVNQAKLIQSAKIVQASKMSSLGTMAAGMCHELNNPLAIAMGNIALIKKKEENLSEFALDKLDVIKQSCDRMRKIVDHLRSFAREDEVYHHSHLNLTEVVHDSFLLLQNYLKEQDIKWTIEAPEAVMMDGNRNRLESIFQNLIINSRDAFLSQDIGAARHIKISCEKDQSTGHIKIRYSDNAGGMPQDVVDQLFEPFFTTKDPGVGTGLGMSIAYGIVSEHQGSIQVKSSLELGQTVFEMLFPERLGETVSDKEVSSLGGQQGRAMHAYGA